jgi:predicted  nucleic acid-binding Zn-ribbon protein
MIKNGIIVNNVNSAQGVENLEKNNEASHHETALRKLSSFETKIKIKKEKIKDITEKLIGSVLSEDEISKLIEETKSINEELQIYKNEISSIVNKELENTRKQKTLLEQKYTKLEEERVELQKEIIRQKKEKRFLKEAYAMAEKHVGRNWEKDLLLHMKKSN